MTALLTVDSLSMRFGGLIAVNELSFTAEMGQITAIIGPNGAGKTTFFNCLTGFYRPTSGTMTLSHEDKFQLHALSAPTICSRAKVARTFQNLRLFEEMTVLENLLVAEHVTLMKASRWSLAGLFSTSSWRQAETDAIERARVWLTLLQLVDRADDLAAALSYGDRRRLEIARALMTQPKLLCLDEPAAGLNAQESAALNEVLRELRQQHGISILLIEHDMSVVMAISDKIVVLDYGAKIAEGTPTEIKANPNVIAAYLGA